MDIKKFVKKAFSGEIFANEKADVGSLVDVVIGLTLLLVILGTVFAPVGLVTFAATNRTSAGITSGTTNGTIWDAIIPLVFLTLIVGIFGVVKKSYT